MNAASSRGIPRLIAETWRGSQGRATWQETALFLVLFSQVLLVDSFGLGVYGCSYPGVFLAVVWAVLLEYRYGVGDEGHPIVEYPVSPTWRSACRLFSDVGRAPGEVWMGKPCPQTVSWWPWKAIVELQLMLWLCLKPPLDVLTLRTSVFLKYVPGERHFGRHLSVYAECSRGIRQFANGDVSPVYCSWSG